MTVPWAGGLAVLTLTFVLMQGVRLFRNIRRARASKLPVLITPFVETEVPAFLLSPLLRRYYQSQLDKHHSWPRWCRFIIKDWTWEEKRLSHELYGETFLCVSPGGIICYSADAAVANEVFTRRNDFIKPPDKISLLGPFGPNVATTEGKVYQFHVKVTAAAFNDINGVNELVWNETMAQARKLLSAHATDDDNRAGGAEKLVDDISNLTLSVICLAGFGQRIGIEYNKEDLETKSPLPRGSPSQMSFFQAILQTTRYIFAILVLPKWLLYMTPLRPAYDAHQGLDSHMRTIIRQEQSRTPQKTGEADSSTRGNLLSSLLRFSASEDKSGGRSDGLKRSFTEEEVMGNLFIYLLAGHETTANAMFYALVNLALYPDIQQSVQSEIDMLSASTPAPTYSTGYSQLRYLHGFMYEIFRLFPGAIVVTKMTSKPAFITTSTLSKHYLSQGIGVYLNAPAIHYAEHYWPNAEVLDPDRWQQAWEDGVQRGITAPDRTRQMHGAFITFSEGARACLGRKFAQAEMVAFLVTVLRDFKIELGPGAGKEDVEREIRDTSAGRITLGPRSAPDIFLRRRVDVNRAEKS